MIRTIALLAATASLAVAPVAAQAAPQRTAAPVSAESEEIRGNPFILPVLFAIALAIGIILLSNSDDPESP